MREGATHRDFNLWVAGLGTAMRQGELLGLCWQAIDFDARWPKVAQLSLVDGKWYVNPPKSRRSRRVLPLPQVVTEALQRQHEMQMADRIVAGPRWFGDELGDLVFRNRDGSPMIGSNATKRFEYWLEKVGIGKSRFHDGTRASCATFLAVGGVPVATAQAILGHSASSLTLEIGHTGPAGSRARRCRRYRCGIGLSRRVSDTSALRQVAAGPDLRAQDPEHPGAWRLVGALFRYPRRLLPRPFRCRLGRGHRPLHRCRSHPARPGNHGAIGPGQGNSEPRPARCQPSSCCRSAGLSRECGPR